MERRRTRSVRRDIRKVARAIIIDAEGRFLLQQRDDIPDTLQPSKVCLLGRHREGDESFLQCVVREIQEEISYFVTGDCSGDFFIARDVPVDGDRRLFLIVEQDKLATVSHKCAPFTRFVMEALVDKQTACQRSTPTT